MNTGQTSPIPLTDAEVVARQLDHQRKVNDACADNLRECGVAFRMIRDALTELSAAVPPIRQRDVGPANYIEDANEIITGMVALVAKKPAPSGVAPDPLRVALQYAAATLENEYRNDPPLQDLARSLRAALEMKV